MLAVAAVVVPVVVACLLGAGVIAGVPGAPSLSVSIAPVFPYPEPGDENVAGLSGWEIDPKIAVRFRRACPEATFDSTSVASFDGSDEKPEESTGGGEGFRAGEVWHTSDQIYASPGDVVRYSVKVGCGPGRTASSSRTFTVPAASCYGGPVRIYELSGTVRRYGGGRAGRAFRAGDLLAERGFLVGPGSSVVVGAPECNGFRMTFGPGLYSAGSYDAGGRGDSFWGHAVLARGDGHAGGFSAMGLVEVVPLGVPCDECDRHDPSSYAVTTIRRTVRIRVWRGSVRVSANGDGWQRLVQAGQELSTRCPKLCLQPSVRLFQPGEELRRYPFAPPRSQVTKKLVPAAGGEPEQLVVSWSRQNRAGAGREAGYLKQQEGVLIWQRRAGRWQVAYRYRIRNQYGRFTTGDVNGDGHADVLIEDQMDGSSGCADWHLLATVRGRLRELLHGSPCEGGMALEHGGLEVDRAIGPCPYAQGSAHCFGGEETTFRRWSGTRLVEKRTRVACDLPRLDPKRNCQTRRS